MSGKRDLTEVYEALRIAEAEGRTEDVVKLIGYIESVQAAPDDVAEETYDPRDLVDKTIPAGVGAAAGAFVPKVLESAADQVRAGRAAKLAPSTSSVTVQGAPISALADIEEATTKGLSNEITQQTRTAQRAARTEQMEKILAELKAKGIAVNPKILAEMEAQYARPGSGILIPVERAKEIAAQEAAAKAAPKALPKNATYAQKIASKFSPVSGADISNFAKGVYDYKLPLVGSMGSLLGRGLVGAGAGVQGADVYNRYKMGDTTGSVISGIGAAGTTASLFPHPAAKAIGTGIGLSAEAINAYRDAMRRGQIEHGAPENYENVDQMGNAFAQGGLVHLANGGKPVPNPEDLMGTFSYAPGYYAEIADNIVPEGKSAGPNDAARHMLAAADLTRRIGKVPLVGKQIAGPLVKGLGYGHELANYVQNIGGGRPQTREDMEQDLHNNALGIQLGQNAGSFQDIVNKIPGAVNVRPYRKEPGKAYIRNPQEAGTPYKPFGAFSDGGPVQNFQVGGIARLAKMAKDLSLPAAENAARTQIIGTLPTYGKAADIFTKQGATGQALDFGAGLGKGADLLGPGTHTYEPFAQGWNPTYTNAKDIPSDAYNRLTNLNVLNVVPRDVRDEMVLDIGRTMEPGGTGIITTRGADVMKAKGRPGPEPTSIITSRDTYQKGFSKQELEDYLRYMLGQGYDINKLNLGPAGAMIQKKAAGGLAHLADGGSPPKSDADEGAAFIGYRPVQRQEKNKYGSASGFLDALVGAPPSKENILDPRDLAYMQGYEKGEPYGIAGMVLPFAGAARGAVKPLAREIGTRAFMGESLLPKTMRQLVPEMQPAGIIKNEKGGNWMPEKMSDYNSWTPENQLAETLGFNKNDPALENWVNTQLTRYVKNEMGTPVDPIRALADKGVIHYKPRPSKNAEGQFNNVYYRAEDKRQMAGMPEGESALTQLGKDWESNVDLGINTNTIDDKMISEFGNEFPWLEKSKGQKLNSIDQEFLYSELGFDHMVDVLREQIASGTLRPESLKSLSVPQAVQRVHEYNLAKEKAMQKTALQAEKEMPVHKEYEGGYKWLNLTVPEVKELPQGYTVKHAPDTSGVMAFELRDSSGKLIGDAPTMEELMASAPVKRMNSEKLKKALKYEGDKMGHCVGGYCEDVIEGNTKIYSLRDAKGEPHVTIEVAPRIPSYDEVPQEVRDAADKVVPPHIYPTSPQAEDMREAFIINWKRDNPVMDIVQIKGKQNAAPKDEYKKYVQDFVRSGTWSRVKDIENAGLKNMDMTGSNYELTNVPEDIAKISHTERYHAVQEAVANKDLPKYATEEEVADAIRKYARKPE